MWFIQQAAAERKRTQPKMVECSTAKRRLIVEGISFLIAAGATLTHVLLFKLNAALFDASSGSVSTSSGRQPKHTTTTTTTTGKLLF